MEEQEYRIWWQLHRRVATGASLPSDERHTYETGRAALEAEEMAALPPPARDWQQWRERWRELQQRARQLAQQESALRQQAAQLEQRYLALTGEQIGLEV